MIDPAVPLAIIAVLLVALALASIRIVPQARAYNIERFGRYTRTLGPGLNFIIPGVDRVNTKFDLREQVFTSRPQPVITEDNLVVNIDTVLYYQVTDAKDAAYEIANYIQAIDQLTVTTLRNVIGSMDLERTLTSREEINTRLRGVLDETTGKWGIRVNRVEIKAIDPPPTIKEAMEKQMRADRDKRAAILHAEGERQSRILRAEGARQQAILEAQGEQQAAILRADGEAQAIERVFQAVHANNADAKLLAYKYLETLPDLAKGEGNTFWVIPGEFTEAIKNVSHAFAGDAAAGTPSTEKEDSDGPAQIAAPDPHRSSAVQAAVDAAEAAQRAVDDARSDVRRAGTPPGQRSSGE
ncbi:SPFH domain-containing protein [Nocardiopsis algeriensis]|uniref:Regulator of protease activity HflC (Stomatin/prohibitin superfamily) n=1 Tax=Nocardiopsis algeriensis TaxID=1478215 RepID=A0A841ILW5_9ACTN|nr:SPFH domain-containing protein [Nocardiopsis algeriensis]MBB6119014.1 regulator of protease activity HflC (stomatin/prohibitin superfamily) [Nocardiopsis algeriensis]